MPTATDVPDVLHQLLNDPGRPRLTWYGVAGERVELSAKVLENWVAKTANLLVDELDAEPGTVVALDLPVHWRTVVWLFGTWAAGAHAVLGPAADADVLVTDDPAAAPEGPRLVAVSLPALANRFTGVLPDGAVDAATEVRLQPDVFTRVVPPAPGDPALSVAAGAPTSYGALVAAAYEAARRAGVAPGDRVLTGAGPDQVLAAWLGPLSLDGSVVLHSPDLDGEELARIRAQESITAVI